MCTSSFWCILKSEFRYPDEVQLAYQGQLKVKHTNEGLQ